MSGDAAPAAAAPAASTKALITPLINAASQGKVVTVMQLLDLGADPNATNKRGLTALHKAAISNQAAAAVTLILETSPSQSAALMPRPCAPSRGPGESRDARTCWSYLWRSASHAPHERGQGVPGGKKPGGVVESRFLGERDPYHHTAEYTASGAVVLLIVRTLEMCTFDSSSSYPQVGVHFDYGGRVRYRPVHAPGPVRHGSLFGSGRLELSQSRPSCRPSPEVAQHDWM